MMTSVCKGGSSFDYAYDVDSYEQQQIFDDFTIFDDWLDLPDSTDLFSCRLPSIQGDVEKIAANGRTHSISEISMLDMDTKPEIRNVDCMWSSCSNMTSGNNSSNNNNNSNSAASSYSESSAMPPAIVTGSTLIIKQEPDEPHNTVTCSSNSNKESCGRKSETFTGRLANKSRVVQKIKPIVVCAKNNNTDNIMPGESLLRKNNTQHSQSDVLQQQRTLHLVINNSSSNSNSKSLHNTGHTETPQSNFYENLLPEFRHNVDLRACVMGSNKISLTNSADAAIDHISRELQDTDKKHIDLSAYRMTCEPQINDVLDVISQQQSDHATHFATDSAATATTAADATATTAATIASLSPPATTATSSDCDSDDGDCFQTLVNKHYMRHISDHSYTRCNEMDTNLETPSDSDEEIDVVSLNDKNLPTNSSDRDLSALLTLRKVAHRISNGARTLPPPRRGRYNLPYTPASSSPVKSMANSRYPSPSSTPYQSGNVVGTVYSPESLSQSSNLSSSSSSSSDTAMPPANGHHLDAKSRKRFSMNDSTARVCSMKGGSKSAAAAAASYSSSVSAAKKSRVKKVNTNELIGNMYQSITQTTKPQANSSNGNSSINNNNNSSSSSSSSNSSSGCGSSNLLKRQFSLDEADTIEKRNLHNDMERQRRIGLKNLFEALKKQIPNIRDKERAPKVNILREAAKLCEQLTNEERELSLKRQLLKAKLKQGQDRLNQLRNASE